jgi:hypothetical protein
LPNTEFILGLAGIFGTAVAGIGSNCTTLVIERRRQRREDRNEMRALRRAIRLVRSDLEGAATKFGMVGDRHRLWPESEPLTDGYLERFRDPLAADLDPSVWTAVLTAESAINKVVTVLVEYGMQNMGARPPVEGLLVDLFEFAEGACLKAADALLRAEASLGEPRRRR